jgi:hypothetical protein
MNSLRQAWDRLWFSRLDPVSVGAFRISLGVLLLVYYIALWPNWQRYYAADGMLSLDANNPSPGATHFIAQAFGAQGLAPAGAPLGPMTQVVVASKLATVDAFALPTRGRRPLLSVFTWTEGVVPIGAFWWVGAVAAVGFALGLRTRFWTAVLLIMHTSLMTTNNLTIIGEDSVSRLLLFLGLFAPLGDRLSLDAWLKARREGGKGPPDESPWPTVWAVRLMQINVAAIYAFSVPRKFTDSPDWSDGSFMYWTMLNSRWSRWPWPELFYGTRGEVLSLIATFGTLLIEGGFPIFVWFRPIRMYVLGVAAALHLGVAVCLQGVTFFQFAMICSFWLFVPAEVTRRWGHALARLMGQSKG